MLKLINNPNMNVKKTIEKQDYTNDANPLLLEIILKKDYDRFKKIIKPWRGEPLKRYDVPKKFKALPFIELRYLIVNEKEYIIPEEKLTIVLGIFNIEDSCENYKYHDKIVGFRAYLKNLQCYELVDLDNLLADVSITQPIYVGQSEGIIDFAFPFG